MAMTGCQEADDLGDRGGVALVHHAGEGACEDEDNRDKDGGEGHDDGGIALVGVQFRHGRLGGDACVFLDIFGRDINDFAVFVHDLVPLAADDAAHDADENHQGDAHRNGEQDVGTRSMVSPNCAMTARGPGVGGTEAWVMLRAQAIARARPVSDFFLV